MQYNCTLQSLFLRENIVRELFNGRPFVAEKFNFSPILEYHVVYPPIGIPVPRYLLQLDSFIER